MPRTVVLAPPTVYNVRAVAVDQSAGKIYWTEYYNYPGTQPESLGSVRRSNLDGTGVETLVRVDYASALALDPANGKMYYSSAGSGIHKANLDGSNAGQIYSLLGVTGLAVDPTAGKVYYVTSNAVGTVNVDGTNGQFIFGGRNIQGGDIALNLRDQKAYYTGDEGVYRFNLDGTGLQAIRTGVVDRDGIALDLTANRVYWNETGSAQLLSANLDGTDLQTLRATDGGALEIYGESASAAPAITVHPQSQTVAPGAGAFFTVTATGTPAPTYQWRKGGTAITGATAATYTIASVVTGDAGSYDVVLTNSAGAVTSNAATLTVGALPAVTSATTASATVGAAFTYTITASNSPASFAATGLPGGLALNATSGVISGTPTATGTYPVSLTATNAVGTSAAVTLTITVSPAPVPPAITAQPQTQSASAGGSVTFTVVATGSPSPTYQWRKGTVNISGATNATLTLNNVQAGDAGSYDVVVANGTGSVTSGAAVLTVAPFGTPVILFNGQASPPATLAAATAIQVTMQTSFSGGHIYYTLDGSDPNTGALYAAPLSVTPPATIRAIAYDATETTAAASAPIALAYYPLTASTAGGGTLGVAPPATGAYLANSVVALSATADAGWTFAQWTGDASGSTSPLNVTMDRARTVQAVFTTPLTLTVPAGGGTTSADPAGGAYGYGSVVRVSAVPAAGNYWIRWGGAAFGLPGNPLAFTVTSASPTVSAVFGALPANNYSLTTLVSGNGSVAASPAAAYYASGASVTLTATPASGQIFSGWSGAATGTQNPLALTMDASKSVTATFTQGVAPGIATQPASLTVLSGLTATFTVGVTGTPAFTYQWRKNGTPISGATSAILSLANVQSGDAGSYSVVVTNGNGSATSAAATLTITPAAPGAVVAWGANGAGQINVPTGLTGVTAIAGGYYHSVALKGDGTVVAWGGNAQGETSVPAGLSGVTAISAAWSHTVALKNDGTVEAWGQVSDGGNMVSITVPASLSGVTAIATGHDHTVARKNDGTVVAWGFNAFGQTSVPSGLTAVIAVAAGDFHSLALRSDGTVLAWGRNDNGQATVPAGLSGVTAIAAGENYSVALKNDGTVVAWGVGGGLSAGTVGVSAIAVGYRHVLALKNDGTVVAGGFSGWGPPTVPAGLSGVVAIAAGSFHCLALKSDGTVVAWGRNESGQANIPMVSVLGGVKAVAAGDSHTVALRNDSTVLAWGSNASGESTVPVGLTGVIALAVGNAHTVALKSDGTVRAWGSNNYGQTTVPTGLTGVTAVAAGDGFTVALKSDGTVVAWGNNGQGQTNIPSGLSGVSAIAARRNHTVALKSDGSVVAWGMVQIGYGWGAETVPAGLTGVTAIAAGDGHALALRGDGTVVAWGAYAYDYGQTTVPAGLTGVTAIAAGSWYSMALKTDGTVVTWGANTSGERTLPPGLTGVTAIAAGAGHAAAVVGTAAPVAPAIVSQPTNLTVTAGHPATFTAVTTGTLPLTYQWKKNGATVSTSTNATLILSPAQVADAGSYSVVVTNSAGTATSNSATLTVNASAPGTVLAWGYNVNGETTVPAGLSGVTAIASGDNHTVALKADGMVVAWGTNGSGQTTVPAGLIGVTAIAAGGQHSVALKNDGTVVAWGYNGYGQTAVPAGLTGVTAIAAGSGHTVILKGDGTVLAWGYNGYGQSTVPAGLAGVTAIAAAGNHTVALKSDGAVVAWGVVSNGYSGTVETVPSGLAGVVAIAAGSNHTVALKADGSVVTWGYNGSGQLTAPLGFSGSVAAIAAGMSHTVVLKSDGSVLAWGDNTSGQIVVPVGLGGVKAIAAGSGHTVVLVGTAVAAAPVIVAQPTNLTVTAGHPATFTAVTTGTLPLTYQWRKNGTVVSTSTNATLILSPAQTSDAGSYTVVITNSAGTATSNAATLTVNASAPGTVLAWGYNVNAETTVPVGLSGITAVASGDNHTVALKTDGTVAAWGYNSQGQTTVPVGLTGVTAVAAGGSHTVTLKIDGTVVAWGYNAYGQTAVPAGLTGVIAIAAGSGHTVVLKSDGTVLAWGYNGQGQATVPAGLAGVTAIAAAGNHTVALKSDGTVVAWGTVFSGYYSNVETVPADLSGVTAIAAGTNHTVALKADGAVVMWGYNGSGQLTAPLSFNGGVTAIAAGANHTAVLKSDGMMLAWGDNTNGQTVIPVGLGGVKAITAGGTFTVALIGTALPAAPVIVSQPANLTVTAGHPATFTAVTTGTLPLNYQWKKNGATVSTSTNPTLILSPAQTADAGSYTVVISNGTGTATSNAAALTVNASAPGTVLAWGYNATGESTVPAALSGVTAIASGDNHTVALKTDGTVVAWGSNGNGQTTVPVGLTGVTAIAAGGQHSVALKNDGTVVAWGYNAYGQTAVPAGLTGIIAIAAGSGHSVALKSDGTIVAWGYNGQGQTTVPAGLSGVTAIAAAGYHTVALKSDGIVVAWGTVYAGYYSNLETVPAGLSGVTAIAAGTNHTMALKGDGTVVMWGYNSGGQLTAPLGFSGGVTAIAAGAGHSVVLKSDGTMLAWGDNSNGQTVIPVGLGGVKAITAGGAFTVALVGTALPVAPVIIAQPSNLTVTAGHPALFTVAATGTLPLSYQWKKNGTTLSSTTNSALVLSNVQTAEAGSYSVVVSNGTGTAASGAATLTVNPSAPGTVLVWGDNTYSQKAVPAGLSGVIAIAAGGNHVVALKNDRTIAAWGLNDSGQTTVPAGLTGVTALAAGNAFTIALKTDATVAAWGYNGYGQTTVPADLTGVKAIAAGTHFAMALKNDGTVVAWGYSGYGQTTVPAGLSGVTAIAAGTEHAAALRNDGTVVAWGKNNMDQTTVPTGLTGVTAIAAGFDFTVALKSDGTVVAWGDNSAGQTNVPAGLTGVVAIAAGGKNTVAFKGNGAVVEWGDNSYGQLAVPPGLTGVTAISAGGYFTAALIGTAQPIVTTQPASRVVTAGYPVTFTGVASGLLPLSLQWRKNGVDIAGATNASLTLPSVQAADGGAYTFVVTNAGGTVTSTAATLTVFAAPQLAAATYLGNGASRQGTGVVVGGGTAYLAGVTSENGQDGLLAGFSTPLANNATPAWTALWPGQTAGDGFNGVALGSDGVYVAGSSDARTTDATGTKEIKGIVVKFPLGGATSAGYAGATWDRQTPGAPGAFSFGGAESLQAVATAVEGGQTYVYATGAAQLGSANAGRFFLSKLPADGGAVLWTRDDSGAIVGNAASRGAAIAVLNGSVYVAGANADGGAMSYLRKYDATGALAWSRTSSGSEFGGIVASGGALYLVGSTAAGAASDFLIEKWSEAGGLVWSRSYDRSGGEDHLHGAVVVNGRYFAVGSTTGGSAGGSDAAVLEFLPDSGELISTTLHGGTADDVARGAAADGTDLYVVGHTASFGPGSASALLLRFAITGNGVVAPDITAQPISQTVPVGQTATFTVGATGFPAPTYQWRKDGAPINGATNATLVLANTQPGDAGSYSVVVANNGGSVTSSAATLTVSSIPAITSATTAAATVGTAFTYTITASNSPTAFAASGLPAGLSLNTGTGVISGTPAATGTFSVLLTAANAGGTSPAVSLGLTVNPPDAAPAITTPPASRTVNVGQTATFTVVATGNPAPTYQWRKAGADIAGATGATLTLANVQAGDAGSYDVVVSNGVPPIATSQAAVLTVNVPPTITTQPAGTTIVTGSTTTLAVGAVGTGPLGYQWYQGAAGITTQPISGATGASFTTPVLTAAASYWVRVTGPAGTVDSATATVAVASYAPAVALTLDGAQRYLTTGGQLTFHVRVTFTGQTPTNLTADLNLPAGWSHVSTGGPNLPQTVPSDGTAGLVTWSYAVIPANEAQFSVVVSTPPGQSGTKVVGGNVTYRWIQNSEPLVVNVTLGPLTLPGLTPAAITENPQPETALAGGTVTFRVVATGSAPLAYQWRRNGADIGGATGASYTLATVQVTDAGNYDVVVSNGVGAPVTSSVAALTVNAPPAVVTPPQSQTVAAGAAVTFTVSATGSPPPTYQWRRDGIAISGATGASHTIASATVLDAGTYDVVVSNGVGAPVTSAAATLMVNSPVAIVTQPQNLQVEQGRLVTLGVTAMGSPTPTYQWRKDGANIPGATAAALSFAAVAVADGGYYDVVVANGVGAPATSSQALLKVVPTGVSATHLVVGGGYTALDKVTVSATITYTGVANSLGWHVLLPDGWTFFADGGSAGETKPAPGTTSVLDWAWTTIPPSPVTFTYTLVKPAGATGEITLTGLAYVRMEGFGWRFDLVAKPDPLPLKSVAHHSADTDKDFRISLLELTRVIALYNTRNGTTRTGRYLVSPGSEDGFGPDPLATANQVLTVYHSADSSTVAGNATTPGPDGRIDLVELTRVIELYNQRVGTVRKGQYRVVLPPATSEDGFALGP